MAATSNVPVRRGSGPALEGHLLKDHLLKDHLLKTGADRHGSAPDGCSACSDAVNSSRASGFRWVPVTRRTRHRRRRTTRAAASSWRRRPHRAAQPELGSPRGSNSPDSALPNVHSMAKASVWSHRRQTPAPCGRLVQAQCASSTTQSSDASSASPARRFSTAAETSNRSAGRLRDHPVPNAAPPPGVPAAAAGAPGRTGAARRHRRVPQLLAAAHAVLTRPASAWRPGPHRPHHACRCILTARSPQSRLLRAQRHQGAWTSRRAALWLPSSSAHH